MTDVASFFTGKRADGDIPATEMDEMKRNKVSSYSIGFAFLILYLVHTVTTIVVKIVPKMTHVDYYNHIRRFIALPLFFYGLCYFFNSYALSIISCLAFSASCTPAFSFFISLTSSFKSSTDEKAASLSFFF